MKTKLSLILMSLVLMFTACDKEADFSTDSGRFIFTGDLQLELLYDGTYRSPLIAGQTEVVGEIIARIDGDEIHVTYKTSGNWYIKETHLHVAVSKEILFDQITNRSGNPRIGHFLYSNDNHDANTDEFTYKIPKPDSPNNCYFIAAHAVVVGGGEGEGGVVDLDAFNAQFPVGPVEATIQKSRSQSTTAYFEDVMISGGTFLDGIYAEAWCAEDGVVRTLQGNPIAYSTYDLPESIVNNPENLNKVNWILNRIWHGLDAGQDDDGNDLGQYTMGDIQMAIWKLIDVDNQPPVFADTAVPYSDDRIAKIIEMADEYFVPGCGEKIVIILVYENHQNIFITFPLPCEPGEGEETAWGQGKLFTEDGGSWAMYFSICE